jgi:methylenetetrahydrofolate reductase (NADPH)
MHGRKLSKEKKKKNVGSLKLLSVAKRLSDHQAMINEPELYLGTRATVLEPNRDRGPEVLLAKADAGAQFVQTKPCLDVDRLRRYMAKLVGVKFTHRCQIFVTVPVMDSAESAAMLNESTRSGAIPKDVIKRLASASSPGRLGEELAARVLRELRDIPGVAGANLVAYGNIDSIPAVIAAAAEDVAH